MRIIQIGALMSALLLCACESTAVEDNMGKAVAQMLQDQIANPATSMGPNDAPIVGMDPESANNALESMRKDVPDRSAVKRDVVIKIGAQQGSNQ